MYLSYHPSIPIPSSYLCVVPEGEEVRSVEVEGGGAVLVLGLYHGHAGLQQVGPIRVAPHHSVFVYFYNLSDHIT